MNKKGNNRFSFLNCKGNQLLLLVVLLMTGSTLWAAEINLYEVELPTQMATQNFNQAKLLEEALKRVLIRLSGSDKVQHNPLVVTALKETDKYINQFSYHQRREQEQRYIRVIFNEKRIQQLLKEIGQPVSLSQRPLTLVWLVIERDGVPYWVGDSEPLITQEIEKLLEARAMPFVFPLQDLADTTEVSEQDVVQEAIEPLQQNAKRYHAEAILLGRLSQNGTGWHGHWVLIQAGNKTSWDTHESNRENMLNIAMETFSIKCLSSQTVTLTASSDTAPQKNPPRLTLAISGIASGEQYTRALDYLRRLPGVLEVETIEVTPEKTIFHLEGANKESIINAVSKDQLLIEHSLSEKEDNHTLFYKITGD